MKETHVIWKQAKPVKSEGFWRIQRKDGKLVGWYDSKALAIKEINKSPWLQ